MTAVHRFGHIELNAATRQVLIDHKAASLGARAFDVLLALIERRERVVAKNELIELVWPGLVVEENNLQVQISSLRKLFGADAIATVAGHGYRFTLEPTHVAEPAPPQSQAYPNNLPQQVTSFIGRRKEVAELEALLGKTRLLTLTGSGGSGKTRLSLQVAVDSLEQFPDGAWCVELASLADPGLMAQTVATVLGVKEDPGKPIVQTLSECLKDKRMLLLLDNCEHLLDACAQIAGTLARQCPEVTILATSREALGIAGERTYRVPSLSLPERKQAQTPTTLSQYEAVQLFIDRALLVRPDFQVTNQNAPAIALVCWHLDGIPLAIELAAARVRTLSVEEIDGKLDQRFRLLTGGSRTALPRHQTLRALIDWSYDLLSEPERLLLQRLSVFAGGWTLAAAEQVGAGDDVDAVDVLDLLTALCDQSLAVVDEADGHSRYRLLETLRQYARDRLMEGGNAEALCRRHRDYFLALAEEADRAEEADPQLTAAEQAAWFQRLDVEHENLRSALDWSLLEGGLKEGLRLCGALRQFWITRGHLSEGREWCARQLKNTEREERTPERAKALNAAGGLAFLQGDYQAARAHFEESLTIRRELGDQRGIASSLGNLGAVAREKGEHSSSRALHEESLAIMRGLGNRRGTAYALGNLGIAMLDQADFASAEALYEECLAIMRELGNLHGIAISLHRLGVMSFLQGDYLLSRARHEEGLAIERQLGDRRGIASSLESVAKGDYVQGDHRAAIALHQESLAIRRAIGDKKGIAYSLVGCAEVVAALGDATRAARILGAAERLREEIGYSAPPISRSYYDRCTAAARAALGDDAAFDRAWQEGRVIKLEQAMELALEETSERRY